MFRLTQQERMVVFVLMAVLITGSGMELLIKKYPELRDCVNLMESTHLYLKVDINQATFQELVEIPYIGEYTARQIMDYRNRQGTFKSLEELKKVKGIRDKNYAKFVPYLKEIRSEK